MTAARRQAVPLAAACALLALGIWCNTGTLAPYASTLQHPFMWGPCNYPLNIDHFHFKATFLMLDGAPRGQWEFSVVLRRILYPLLAYPFMKLLGYGAGGLVTNVLLAWLGLCVFWVALDRRLDHRAPLAVLALLATYPGWMYWAGLPYSYAAIVPLALLCHVLLWRLEEGVSWRRAVAVGLAMGVLFTGYDLLPFFGVAGVLLLLWRRAWVATACFAVAQLVPTALVAALLWKVWRVPFRNANTEAYFTVLRAYVSPVDLHAWWGLLRQLPRIALDNYLFANFLFLPLLFLLLLLFARPWRPREDGKRPLAAPEIAVLAAAALLFLFNNLAPPYVGWPLRGSWVARLYQPILVPMLVTLAATLASTLTATRAQRLLRVALGVTIAAQAVLVFGPVLGHPWLAGEVYWRFYRHAPRPFYAENVARLGARPVGFCASAPTASDSSTH
jgi:hypothetical protein